MMYGYDGLAETLEAVEVVRELGKRGIGRG
jgi:hypothetical protein